MQISVKQEHIDHGFPGNSCECAIALAANDAFRAALAAAWVKTDVGMRDGLKMRVETDTRVLYFDIPAEVEAFMANFDGVFGTKAHALTRPFTFEPIANEATSWKARTDTKAFERLVFLSEEHGYLLFQRDHEGDCLPGFPRETSDAEAALWLGRNGHAMHERLASRGITITPDRGTPPCPA